jgi:hypothetical protein
MHNPQKHEMLGWSKTIGLKATTANDRGSNKIYIIVTVTLIALALFLFQKLQCLSILKIHVFFFDIYLQALVRHPDNNHS